MLCGLRAWQSAGLATWVFGCVHLDGVFGTGATTPAIGGKAARLVADFHPVAYRYGFDFRDGSEVSGNTRGFLPAAFHAGVGHIPFWPLL